MILGHDTKASFWQLIFEDSYKEIMKSCIEKNLLNDFLHCKTHRGPAKDYIIARLADKAIEFASYNADKALEEFNKRFPDIDKPVGLQLTRQPLQEIPEDILKRQMEYSENTYPVNVSLAGFDDYIELEASETKQKVKILFKDKERKESYVEIECKYCNKDFPIDIKSDSDIKILENDVYSDICYSCKSKICFSSKPINPPSLKCKCKNCGKKFQIPVEQTFNKKFSTLGLCPECEKTNE